MRRILKSVMTVRPTLGLGAAQFSSFSGPGDQFRPHDGFLGSRRSRGSRESQEFQEFQGDQEFQGYQGNRGNRGYRGPQRKDRMDTFMEELGAYSRPRKQEQLGALKKNIYIENEKTKARNSKTVKEMRENGKILVPENTPNPIKHFNELQFGDNVIEYLSSQYQMPTAIQSQAWPIVLSGKDLIGISETGSGKTLGFILPILEHIRQQNISLSQTLSDRMVVAPAGIIVAPVRELARQISEVAKEYEEFFGLRSALFYGGSGKNHQTTHFHEGFHLCIGTPGRLLDFAHSGNLDLERASTSSYL